MDKVYEVHIRSELSADDIDKLEKGIDIGDTNDDGWPDTNLDLDGDGKADVDLDTNNDGKADLNLDTDGDKVM